MTEKQTKNRDTPWLTGLLSLRAGSSRTRSWSSMSRENQRSNTKTNDWPVARSFILIWDITQNTNVCDSPKQKSNLTPNINQKMVMSNTQQNNNISGIFLCHFSVKAYSQIQENYNMETESFKKLTKHLFFKAKRAIKKLAVRVCFLNHRHQKSAQPWNKHSNMLSSLKRSSSSFPHGEGDSVTGREQR